MLVKVLIIGIALVIAIALGRALTSGLSDEKRKIVGGVALLVGVVLTIYGVSSVNSMGSQLMRDLGKTDTGGMLAIGFGVLAGMVGIVILVGKGTQRTASQSPSTRKCPYCAETIQTEAKLCRFCNRSLEVDSPV